MYFFLERRRKAAGQNRGVRASDRVRPRPGHWIGRDQRPSDYRPPGRATALSWDGVQDTRLEVTNLAVVGPQDESVLRCADASR